MSNAPLILPGSTAASMAKQFGDYFALPFCTELKKTNLDKLLRHEMENISATTLTFSHKCHAD